MRISDWSSDVCSSDLTAAPGSFSYDLRGRAPQVSFTSPDPTSPAGMLIDFARLPTVQSDDEEKYAYLDYQHGVEWGPVQALKFGVKYTDRDRGRSEERRVGKECASAFRSRRSPDH